MRYEQRNRVSSCDLVLTLQTICAVPSQHVVRYVTNSVPAAISNPFNTTVMPVQFRWLLVFILAMNLAAMIVWCVCVKLVAETVQLGQAQLDDCSRISSTPDQLYRHRYFVNGYLLRKLEGWAKADESNLIPTAPPVSVPEVDSGQTSTSK
jgi:hypothetical protein